MDRIASAANLSGIAAARLSAIPEATTCVRCQEIEEGMRS